jgi:hypothetical protein
MGLSRQTEIEEYTEKWYKVDWKDSLGNTHWGGPMPESEYPVFVQRIQFYGGRVLEETKEEVKKENR